MAEPTQISENQPDRPGLLRRHDQQILAALVVIGWLGLLAWWWQGGGPSGSLTEWNETTGRTARFEVNVNTATWPELSQLPEIGETLARRIVENRRAEGPFQSPEDLTRVRGIGVKTLDRMRPYLASDSWSDDVSQTSPRWP